MKARWLLWLTLGLALIVYAACGGAQTTEEDPGVTPDGSDPRWESPPPDQGQTPPDREPPIDALEPFDREGSGL